MLLTKNNFILILPGFIHSGEMAFGLKYIISWILYNCLDLKSELIVQNANNIPVLVASISDFFISWKVSHIVDSIPSLVASIYENFESMPCLVEGIS